MSRGPDKERRAGLMDYAILETMRDYEQSHNPGNATDIAFTHHRLPIERKAEA